MSNRPVPSAVGKDGCYLTYPHANGFAEGALILGRVEGWRASIWKIQESTEHCLCDFDISGEREPLLWFDVAFEADRLVTVAQGAVWCFDLNKSDGGREIFRPKSGEEITNGLVSVTADGTRALIGLRCGDGYSVGCVDVASGQCRVLCEFPWFANHFHFCPFDEDWIGLCHEGPCEQIEDRVWAWHEKLAPEGRCLFPQHWGDARRELNVGHERWHFHAASASVVAYGAGCGEPRGIYEVTVGGNTRLVSPGDRDLHVNVSRDGRWLVADTSGPHDRPGKGWENAEGISDILLIDPRDGSRRWLARTRLHARHPWHPHPVFSPDGRYIYFNEAMLPDGGRVMRVANPFFWENGSGSAEEGKERVPCAV